MAIKKNRDEGEEFDEPKPKDKIIDEHEKDDSRETDDKYKEAEHSGSVRCAAGVRSLSGRRTPKKETIAPWEHLTREPSTKTAKTRPMTTPRTPTATQIDDDSRPRR